MLTQEYLKTKVTYEPSTGVFTSNRTGKEYKSMHPKGYRMIGFERGHHYYAHRLAWFYMYGEWPEPQIDHIDRNKSNNKLSNLRIVNNRRNQLNKGIQLNNTTGFTGVGKVGNRYTSKTKVNRQDVWIGTYDTPEEANIARLEFISSIQSEVATRFQTENKSSRRCVKN